jgi:YesN/AraC family two-component response regulator
MPEMAGVEFLQRVKDLYPDVVRIMLSGYTDFHSITDAINRGAVYKFLTKPWDDEQLRDNIGEAFRRYQPATQSGRQPRDACTIDPEAHDLPSPPSQPAADMARAD